MGGDEFNDRTKREACKPEREKLKEMPHVSRKETGRQKQEILAGKVSPGYDMWIWGCHQVCEVEIIKN